MKVLYRVSHLLVIDLGLVDFDLSVPPFCPAAKPLLPNSHQPRQSWADSGTIKIQVNINKSTTRCPVLRHPIRVGTRFTRIIVPLKHANMLLCCNYRKLYLIYPRFSYFRANLSDFRLRAVLPELALDEHAGQDQERGQL